MTAHLIDTYRNIPGEHCGSTAMRNLVFHYCGLDLAEEEIFGLGSGLDCVVIENEAFTPGILLFGRGAAMETDCTEALGIDYREQIEADDRHAWEVVRAEVEAGRPTMLSGDALYLDYRDFRVHFPSHRFVLLGFDDAREIAYVADRIDPEPQECSYEALAKSRNPSDFLSTYNLWGRFAATTARRTLVEAYEHAIARNAARMIAGDRSDLEGMKMAAGNANVRIAAGLAALEEVGDLIARLPEHPRGKQIARYAASCIESFGTGGGNFRTLYARFLAKAREVVPYRVSAEAPELAGRSSKLWTTLSAQLAAFAKSSDGQAPATSCEIADLRDSRSTTAAIVETETRLFEQLAAPSATA